MLVSVQVVTVQRVIQPRLRFHRFAHGLVNLVDECRGYLRRAQASAIMALTAREERRI
jgi:hypothetical protein